MSALHISCTSMFVKNKIHFYVSQANKLTTQIFVGHRDFEKGKVKAR